MMINPWRLLSNALWIVGLALGMAAWSFGRWQAQRQGLSVRQVLGQPQFALPLSVGLILFCIGLALSARSSWETAAWSVLALLTTVQAVYSWRRSRHGEEENNIRRHPGPEEP